jgi:hypothetical protein
VFADQIDDAPPPVALLDVWEGLRGHFRPAETAPEKHGENGATAQADHRRYVGRT